MNEEINVNNLLDWLLITIEREYSDIDVWEILVTDDCKCPKNSKEILVALKERQEIKEWN